MPFPRFRCVLFTACLLCWGSTLTLGEDAKELDFLAISRDFLTLPRAAILIAEVPQPPQPSGKLRIASDLGRIMTEELLSQAQTAAPTAKVSRLEAAPPGMDGLVVACHFSKLQPGSRAKRFWVGFGAGKSILELSGEVRERQTNRLVARFTHARASWCCGYGSNDTEIRNNLVEVARDVAGWSPVASRKARNTRS